MSNLKSGFAKVDITPPLGTTLQGYYSTRYADGVLDPLYSTAVAFDNGEKRAVVISIDHCGIMQFIMDELRAAVANAIGAEDIASVFIFCTHTHLGPCATDINKQRTNIEYFEQLKSKLCDVAVLAFKDLAPTTMLYTHGNVKDVSFVRRFRMKDGSVRTNPGFLNPDIDHVLGEPDETSSLLILKRENKPEIGIVHFQVHPDVISGTKISADFPGFVRRTYEALVPNSHCMYINGAEGDTNHIDVRLGDDKDYIRRGYERAAYMGEKIALSVIANYRLAEPLEGDKISFAQKSVFVKHNKGTAEEYEQAMKVHEVYVKTGSEAPAAHVIEPDAIDMRCVEIVAQCERIVSLASYPDEKELLLTALSVGDVAFAGFPGEPFTDIGRSVKDGSKFTLTLPVCLANASEGYYPMQRAFDEGGYEALTARYVKGTAEKLIEKSLDIINKF